MCLLVRTPNLRLCAIDLGQRGCWWRVWRYVGHALSDVLAKLAHPVERLGVRHQHVVQLGEQLHSLVRHQDVHLQPTKQICTNKK